MRAFRAIARLAEGVNEVIGHPVAFVIALIQTGVWTSIILVNPHLDPHGFWFLYVATAVSYVTQFTLTLVSLTAKKEAARASADSRRTTEAMLATMKVLHELVGAERMMLERIDEKIDETEEEIDTQLGEIHDLLVERVPQ